MDNSVKFDRCVGLILGYLLDNFPYRIVLKSSDIVGLDDSLDDDFVGGCVEFLSDEGLLLYKQKALSAHMFSCARLSLKGLNLLKADIELSKGKTTAEKVLLEAFKNGSYNVLQNVASGVLLNLDK